MAIAFRAAAASKRTTGGTSLVMTLPAGRQAGDVAVAQLAFGDNITALAGLTGWTQFSWSPLAMGTGRVHYFWKVLDGTETDPTVTWTTSAKPIFEVACWSGVDNTTPFEAHNGAVDSVSNTDVASPTVNNTGDGTEWAVAFFTYRTSTAGDKTATYNPPAGLTERSDDNISAATSAPYLMCEAADSNGAVAAGNHQYTSDCTAGTASANKASALIYLNPAGAGGTPKSDADADGSSTETSSLAAALSSADADGADAEASTLAAALGSSDSSGAASESASVSVPIAGSDASGGASEASSLAASLPSSDASAPAVDSGALQAQIGSSEANGAAAEAVVKVGVLAPGDASSTISEDVSGRAISTPDSSGGASESAAVGADAARSSSDASGPASEQATVTVQPPLTSPTGGRPQRLPRRIVGRGTPAPPPARKAVRVEDHGWLDVLEHAQVYDHTADQRREEENILLLA